MVDPYRKQRLVAGALMLLSLAPLAFGCWRLYVWQWGQPGDFVRYDPPPPNWQQLQIEYQALADKARREDAPLRGLPVCVDEEMVSSKGEKERSLFVVDGRDDGSLVFHVLNVNFGLFRTRAIQYVVHKKCPVF